MSVRVDCIRKLLSENHKTDRHSLPELSWKEIQQSPLLEKVLEVYKELGGAGSPSEIPLPLYDIEFEHLAIQLDEEKNFNRYRALTIQSSVYIGTKIFSIEKYKSYCRTNEPECLKSASHGKFWTNPFAEKLFGNAAEPGDLHKIGSPEWKYKAFQDFLLDLTPLLLPVRLIRFSIYDNILINSKMYRVGDIVISSRPDLKAALTKNLERRIEQLTLN